MQLWTREHALSLLPALAVMLVLAAVLRHYLKNKPLRIRIIPLQIIAVVLVLLEIGKQIISSRGSYDLYSLPFHFCSLFIFMMPVMAFYKGRHQQTVYGITASLCTSVMLLMLIYPALIYSADNVRNFFNGYLDMHTVAFHNLVLLAAVLVIALRIHEPDKREQKPIVLFMLCFCLVSATMAQLLKTNFNNFYSCNIGPLETVRLQLQGSLGYGLTQALYILIVTVLDILFVLGSYWLYRGLRKLCALKQTVSV